MSVPRGEITHVSDTALMVAAARALEAECADGFVHDPFAARLAGERGMAILEALPRPEMMRFGVSVRSRFLDELLLQALETGQIRTVLSVGCGLDTRPWRLHLPANLRWIEVDFADMLTYKESLMVGETPHCQRERLVADLNDPTQRRAVWDSAHEPSLLITEGLLMYLPAATVEAMATEARDTSITHWICDLNSSAFAKAIQMDLAKQVRDVQAPDSLPGEEIFDALRRNGWGVESRRSYLTDMGFAMDRIRRLFGERPQNSPPPQIPPDDPTGVLRFARA